MNPVLEELLALRRLDAVADREWLEGEVEKIRLAKGTRYSVAVRVFAVNVAGSCLADAVGQELVGQAIQRVLASFAPLLEVFGLSAEAIVEDAVPIADELVEREAQRIRSIQP